MLIIKAIRLIYSSRTKHAIGFIANIHQQVVFGHVVQLLV